VLFRIPLFFIWVFPCVLWAAEKPAKWDVPDFVKDGTGVSKYGGADHVKFIDITKDTWVRHYTFSVLIPRGWSFKVSGPVQGGTNVNRERGISPFGFRHKPTGVRIPAYHLGLIVASPDKKLEDSDTTFILYFLGSAFPDRWGRTTRSTRASIGNSNSYSGGKKKLQIWNNQEWNFFQQADHLLYKNQKIYSATTISFQDKSLLVFQDEKPTWTVTKGKLVQNDKNVKRSDFRWGFTANIAKSKLARVEPILMGIIESIWLNLDEPKFVRWYKWGEEIKVP